MSLDVQRYQQRCYPVLQTTFDTIVTPTNADCCLISSLTTDASQTDIARPDKTGTLDILQPQGGRRVGAWSASMSAAGNGTAGVAPDCKSFLQAGFGKAPTVVAATSVTYALDDLLYYLSIWNFNAPSGAKQFVAFNSLVNKLEFTAGGDVPTITASGESGWVYDSAQAADGTTDPLAKGGLGSFPAEPSTPVSNGTHPPGFKIAAIIDGNSYSNILTLKITVDVARELRKDTNSEFPRTGAAGARKVSLDWEMTDSDDTNLNALHQKVMNRTPINAVFTVGTIAGNRWVHTVNNFIAPKPKYGDAGIRRKMTFSGALAIPSAIGAKDQYTLGLT